MALEKLSLVDRATLQLRQMIVGADLSPGQRLTEQELSDEMQVARGTIRAALAALIAENLVVRRPYAGWTVQSVNNELLREHYQVRGAFEELSARLVAASLDEGIRGTLNAAYDQLIEAEHNGDAESRLQADLGFHASMIQASKNQLLIRQYESIAGQTEWLYRWSENNWPRRINLLDWHKPIVDAVLSEDPEAAAFAVRSHTQRSLHDDMQDLHNKSSQ